MSLFTDTAHVSLPSFHRRQKSWKEERQTNHLCYLHLKILSKIKIPKTEEK